MKAVAFVGALACIFGLLLWGPHRSNYPTGPIRSDGLGYYVYLPALLRDHDLALRKTFAHVPKAHPEFIATPVPPHGRLLDRYGIGESIMLAPFFGVGYLVASVTNTSTNGFSRVYQLTATAGSIVYGVLGLLLLASILGRWFRDGVVALTVLAITFGSDLFNYLTFEPLMSHAFSFFLVAAVIRLTLCVWETPHRTNVAMLGAALGLVAAIRPTNLTIVAFCALVGVSRGADLRARAVAVRQRLDLVAVGALAAAVAFLPQVAYWYAVTGKPYADGYPAGQSLLFLHPHVWDVLFSVRKGLFFWTPLLLIATAGLGFLSRAVRPPLLVGAVTYLVLQTWVVSSWTIWWYGISFGMRPFIEALPVFALGLAAILERARTAAPRRALYVGLAATMFLSIHAMFGYWTGKVPGDMTTLHQYFGSFY
jgi:hypothetical protein